MSLNTVKPTDIAVQPKRFYRDGINSLKTEDIEGARPRFRAGRNGEPMDTPEIGRAPPPPGRYNNEPATSSYAAYSMPYQPLDRPPPMQSDNAFIKNQALFYGDDAPEQARDYNPSKPQPDYRNRASDFANSQSRIFGVEKKPETDQWSKNQAKFFGDSQSGLRQYRSNPASQVPAGQFRSVPPRNTNPISQSNFYEKPDYAANQAKFFGDSRAEGLKGNDYTANQAKFFGDSRAQGLRGNDYTANQAKFFGDSRAQALAGNDYNANQAKFFGDSRAEFPQRNQPQGHHTDNRLAYKPSNEYEMNQANFFGDSRSGFKPSHHPPPPKAPSQLPPRNPSYPSYANNSTGGPGARPPLPPPNYGSNYEQNEAKFFGDSRGVARHASNTPIGHSNDYERNQAKFFGDSRAQFHSNSNLNAPAHSNDYERNQAKFFGDSQSQFRKSGTLTAAARNFF